MIVRYDRTSNSVFARDSPELLLLLEYITFLCSAPQYISLLQALIIPACIVLERELQLAIYEPDPLETKLKIVYPCIATAKEPGEREAIDKREA